MRDRCRICAALGRFQHGPLYWLLRGHLNRAGRRMDREAADSGA